MISSLLDFIQRFFSLFIWWTVIQPWEQGIRVRVGKTRTRLAPGLHLKIPYLDLIYRQTTRRRYQNFGPISATTSDGHTITVGGSVGFSITDLDKLYDSLHAPEDSLHEVMCGTVAGYIASHPLAECKPADIVAGARPKLGFKKFGLRTEQFLLSQYARVRTYRLIMDQHPGTWGNALDTEKTTP